MKKRKIITLHSKIITSFFFSLLFIGYFYAYANPPGSPYQAGGTLDPSCTPGSANCFVQIIPSQTGNSGKFLTTDGSVTSWASSTGWSLLGNSGTIPGINFLGTSDVEDLVLATDSTERARFLSSGEIFFGIGSTPAAPFDASPFRFMKDQNERTDVHVINTECDTLSRAGVSGSTSNDNYFALTVISPCFNAGGSSPAWGNKVVLQTGGTGNGLVLYSNEGDMEFNVSHDDGFGAIDFVNVDMIIAAYNRHAGGGRTAVGGTIGMGTITPKAKLDVDANILSDSIAPDFKKALKVAGIMPAAPANDFSAIEFNITGNGSEDFRTVAQEVNFGGSYVGLNSAITGLFTNLNEGDGNDLKWGQSATLPFGNIGVASLVTGSGRLNVAGFFESSNAIELSVGLIGKSVSVVDGGTNIGVIGQAVQPNIHDTTIAGFFSNGDGAPSFQNATILADNGTSQFPVFVGQSNGTTTILLGSDSDSYFNGGNVGIGDATPDYLLDVENTGTDGNIFALHDSDGECLYNPEAGGVTVSCSSDERLKTNITDTTSALSYFSTFRIRDYTVITAGVHMTGVIAQEVLPIHPELVTQGPNGMYSVQLPNQWQVVKAIQEMNISIIGIGDLTTPNTWRDSLVAWFSNATNHITRIFTGEICLTDADGTSECINKTELHNLKQLLNTNPPPTGGGEGGGNPPPITDICPNIDGDQSAIPDGMHIDVDNNCAANLPAQAGDTPPTENPPVEDQPGAN